MSEGTVSSRSCSSNLPYRRPSVDSTAFSRAISPAPISAISTPAASTQRRRPRPRTASHTAAGGATSSAVTALRLGLDSSNAPAHATSAARRPAPGLRSNRTSVAAVSAHSPTDAWSTSPDARRPLSWGIIVAAAAMPAASSGWAPKVRASTATPTVIITICRATTAL